MNGAAADFAVLLVGNYPRDGQESMLRFARCLHDGLRERGIPVELIQPPVALSRWSRSSFDATGKWLAYADKFLLFPAQLRRAVRRLRATHRTTPVVHLCDHSNSMYSTAADGAPVIVTCHDLLAVRGALGEDTDCPASRTGRLLQRWILRRLADAHTIACVSTATRIDTERLVPRSDGRPAIVHQPIGFNHDYRLLAPAQAQQTLAPFGELRGPFFLHVGSNLRRKNREGVLRIFARLAAHWPGQLVFAGQRLSPELRELATSLQLTERIVEFHKPSNDVLEALYNRATALLFPSRFEGFGWPIIEAQVCGCPVLTSRTGPMPEVAGEGALLREVEDEAGFAEDALRLTDPATRAEFSARGLANAQRYGTSQMVDAYVRIYRQAVAAP